MVINSQRVYVVAVLLHCIRISLSFFRVRYFFFLFHGKKNQSVNIRIKQTARASESKKERKRKNPIRVIGKNRSEKGIKKTFIDD